jgi:hypothetical protein
MQHLFYHFRYHKFSYIYRFTIINVQLLIFSCMNILNRHCNLLILKISWTYTRLIIREFKIIICIFIWFIATAYNQFFVSKYRVKLLEILWSRNFSCSQLNLIMVRKVPSWHSQQSCQEYNLFLPNKKSYSSKLKQILFRWYVKFKWNVLEKF